MDCKEINPAMLFYFLQSAADFELLSAKSRGVGQALIFVSPVPLPVYV